MPNSMLNAVSAGFSQVALDGSSGTTKQTTEIPEGRESVDVDASVLESLKVSLSDSLEKYFVQMANKQQPAPAEIYRMYLQSQVISGIVPLSDYSRELDSISKNLYAHGDDAMAWISSVDRENNPWHYEPEAQGQTYGDTTTLSQNMSDVQVDVGTIGVDSSLSGQQREIMNELGIRDVNSMTSFERVILYARLSCDNFYANNDITDMCDGNVEKFKEMPTSEKENLTGNLVIDDGQGVMLDVSEMTVGQKTKLTGPVKHTNIDGKTAEDTLKEMWLNRPEGQDSVSIEVCGGTLTYHGPNWDPTAPAFKTDEVVRDIFHFKSDYLGEFDYDADNYQLSYKTGETTVDGKKQEIAVPILHAKNFDYDDSHWFAQWNNPSGWYKPPEGLKVGDYMFEGCDNLKRMPPLPNSLISAHGMFLNCEQMKDVSMDAITGEGRMIWDYGKGGTIDGMPKNIEDTSYMFANCPNLTQTFERMGEQVWDARGMYQGCSSINVPLDLSNCRNLVWEMAADMYTGCNSDMNAAVNGQVSSESILDENGNPVETNGGKKMNEQVKAFCEQENRVLSVWSRGGSKDTLEDRLQNGEDITSGQKEAWQKMIDADRMIRQMDPSGGGATTGAEALSNGMVGYSVQKLANGAVVVDDSTWSGLRDSYDAPVTQGGNELLDRGLAFLGTMGLSSAVLGGVTKSKWIGLIGGAGIAAGLQMVGIANKLSPLLNSIGDMMGDSKFGQSLHNLADRLEGSTTQSVRDVMSVEQLFDDRQKAAAQYTEAILQTLTKPESGQKVGTGFYQKYADTMIKNGEYIAQDGSLEVIAYTSEEEFSKSCNSAVMHTAADMMAQNIQAVAGSDGTLTAEQKQEFNDCFKTMVYNIQAYSYGAEQAIKAVPDAAKADRMSAGLGKVMRNTSEPVYSMICQMDAKYQILDEETKKMLDSMVPYGVKKFSEYQASFDTTTNVGDIGRPPVDIYVENLAADTTAALQREELMKANGASQSELRKAYEQDMEDRYGWMLDIAASKGVQVDTGQPSTETADTSTEKSTDKGSEEPSL